MRRRVFGIPLPIVLLIPVVIVLLVLILNIGSIVNGVVDAVEYVFDYNSRTTDVIDCSDSAGCSFWQPVIYSALLLFVVVTGFAYATLLERKLVAYFQHRVGPNRIGPGGFLQPAADGLKLIFKENIRPEKAYIGVYRLAPLLKVLPTLIVLAVIPLGPPIVIPWFDGNWYRVPLMVADLNVGILWILAITSLGTYGVALAGWSSANKYSMLGGLRASAQMISYELSMGLALAVPVLIVGSMSVLDIIDAQSGLFINWFVFQNPLAAGILVIALFAETNRAPFDLPEAEQELTAGYMTEYSGMKFALFMMAEYLGMIGVSLIAASTFFGGYHDGFGLVTAVPILGPLVMIGKVILFLALFVWVRATLPRIRYDRLMTLGWKVMLPLSILAVVWTSVAVVISEEMGQTAYLVFSGVTIVVILAVAFLMSGRPQDEMQDDEIELDPVITGERSGLGYAILQFVGALIALPFLLFNFTIQQLENLAKLADDPNKPDSGDKDAKSLPSGGD
ncbi:MAG: hypothetical protein OHK0046_28740 [Anaerolineae bacterium]